VLHGIIDRLTGIRRCCGMKINVKKTDMMKISKQHNSVHIMRDQEQPENVEYYKYFVNMITSDAVCTCEIKHCIALATAAFKRKRTIFTSKLEFNLRKKLV
jgi:hypothetical protein